MTSGPRLGLRARSGSTAVEQPENEVISGAPVNYQVKCGCPGSDHSPETMLVSEGHAAAAAILRWTACTATRTVMTLEPKLLLSAVWVYALAAAGVCVDVHGPCYHKGPKEPTVLECEGRSESSSTSLFLG